MFVIFLPIELLVIGSCQELEYASYDNIMDIIVQDLNNKFHLSLNNKIFQY